MTKQHPEPLRGKLTATEWKKRGARGTLPRGPQVPFVPYEDLDILDSLLLLWATQEPEEGLRKMNLLFSTIPDKPEYREKFLAGCNSFSDRFREGSLLSNLVQTWNERIPPEERHNAALRVANKIGHPLYRRSWLKYRDHLNEKLLKEDMPKHLLSPGVGRINGKAANKSIAEIREPRTEGGAIIPFWLSFFFKSDKKSVEISLRVLLETSLLKAHLGNNYRSKYSKYSKQNEIKTISLSTPIKRNGFSDDKPLTLEDTLAEERWEYYPDRLMYQKELQEIIKDIMKKVKISERELEILWLISEGKKPKEISILMNTTANSIRVSLNKAKGKIQNGIGMDKLKFMTGND